MNAVGNYNFKKIVDLLKQIGEYHEQLQGFSIGDINQLIYYTEERLKQQNTEENLAPYYPLMYVIPDSATSDGRQMVYSLNILVMDIMNTKNFDNEVDVWSDTLDILKDIVAKFKYSIDECYCSWDVNYPVTFTPFSESFDDYLTGWTAKINLVIPDALDNCISPFADFPPCNNNSDC